MRTQKILALPRLRYLCRGLQWRDRRKSNHVRYAAFWSQRSLRNIAGLMLMCHSLRFYIELVGQRYFYISWKRIPIWLLMRRFFICQDLKQTSSLRTFDKLAFLKKTSAAPSWKVAPVRWYRYKEPGVSLANSDYKIVQDIRKSGARRVIYSVEITF